MRRMIENQLNRVLLALCLFVFVASEATQAQVNADFSAPVTSGCGPLIVNFQNLSTGTGLTYQWNLGNGNTSVSQNPSASYITPGTYTITLTATGPGGTDTETKTSYITVFTPPVPNLSPSQGIGCYPFTVNFSDLSVTGDSPIATWSWDFGDGGTSTQQNPSHTYTTPGIFDVTLILTDANGCSSNQSFNDVVESINIRPTAAFTGNPTVSCLPPSDVSFSNTSSGGTGNLTYAWDFGDGNTSTLLTPDNTYAAAGNFDVSLTVTDEYGCSDTQLEVAYIQIVDDVTIDFVTNNTTVCLGEQVSFVDLSTSTPISWAWDFGDGATSTDQFPTHLYTTPGNYEVSLTATYSASCQGTETKTSYITVGSIPFADFTADVVGGCETPFPVQFTNGSIGNGTLSYFWDFGDVNTSTEQDPLHIYTENGTYDVTLTTTNSDGCSSTASKPSFINVALTQADFLPDVFGFCQPLEVNFTDTSISGSPIVNYQWDFGDGGTSNLQNPTYTYADTGIFDVSLIITNDLGCSDTLVRSNYIFVYTPPVADFIQVSQVVCPGEEVSFTNNSQNGTDWYWDFGDQLSSTEENPIHEFADTGYFSITLITLNNGCSDTLIVDDLIYVSPPLANLSTVFSCNEPNTFTFTNESFLYTDWEWRLPDGTTSTQDPITVTFPDVGEYIMRIWTYNDTAGCAEIDSDTVFVTGLEAGFSASNVEDCGPLTVDFTDESTGAVSWKWLFGSSPNSTQQNPSHTYSNIGTYSVSQIVTDINGCKDTLIMPNLVTVTGSVVNAGVDTTFGCETLSVQFTDLTNPPGTVSTWLWDFGDGTTSSSSNPLHVYSNAGVYDVSLTITDIGGCTNTIELDDLVNYIPYPSPSFTVDVTAGCIGEPFTFTNNSTGNAVNYLWNFGDGSTSTDSDPIHSYSAEGTYSVTLTAFNTNGCDSSVTEIQLINIQHPDADFSAFPTFAFCPPLLVGFTDLSSTDAVSWFWNFGDGSSSNLQNPSHIYTQSGMYTVYLVVTNANGCTDTIFRPELIELSGPSGEFTFFPDSVGCPPYDINFASIAENVTTYTWDFGDGFLGSGANTAHTYTETGSFIPTLILEDDNGCTFIYQSADTLEIIPLAVDAGLSQTICESESVQLGATGGDSYSWSPSTGLSDPSVANPSASPSVTTTYLVTISLGQCQNSDSITVFVNPAPQVSFVANEVCFGTISQFTDFSTIASPDSIISWSWDLAESLSTDTNPSITYASAGTFDVSLVLESSSGCSSSGTGTVMVNPTPNAAFSANDTCLFETTFLTDQSTVSPGSITNWNWSLGTGTTSTLQNPSLTYFQDSVYQVTLIVTATGGCTDTITQPVEVFPLPNAVATAANVCLGEAIQFGDSSSINSGNIAEWSWNFGDSNTSTDQHPSHTYANSQTYVYSLTVTSDQGCTDGVSGAITVHPLPVSAFQMTSSSSCFSPASVNLFNQSTGANQFQWNHDNGTIETPFNSTAIFDTVGQYNIELLVTNQYGCQDSSTQLFEVFPTVIAGFESTFPTGCEPWSVTFTDLSENAINYSWDFSDADGSSLTDPTHIFYNPGSYSVQLIVEGLGGCADTLNYSNLVTVWPNPTAQFEYANVPTPIANGTVAFYNTSTPHVKSWWDFGDGGTSTSESTTHNYDIFGNKLITLAIEDANGCVDTVQMYVPVEFFGGLYVPNAIIPQDPNSEVRVFQPKGTGLGNYRCMVYDEWGNILWESTKLEAGSPTEYWDGTYDGEQVPQGSYVWRIDAIFANGNLWDGMIDQNGEYHQVGTVTVLR
ncbi:MAG: PKD domain-containing protein [Flavobacteriales bacterium]|nr:PKD domain-containing protein [Flavobacteriales bacterium]